MTPEGRVKAKFKAHIESLGVPYYAFWPVQTGYGQTTIDCLLFVFDRFYGFECKRKGITEPTPRQKLVMQRIRAAGGRTYVITLDENDNLKWVQIT